ncbi:hypothetical protein [Pandoravirus japonicus]|uniref:Uncharacterized protein n=1 Tax=Pandoravirus japonicus TaxID=2823154 RepID=A0A811BS79_9VIRU|nr:hypothetical protein [Pandoravirus japonicus]
MRRFRLRPRTAFWGLDGHPRTCRDPPFFLVLVFCFVKEEMSFFFSCVRRQCADEKERGQKKAALVRRRLSFFFGQRTPSRCGEDADRPRPDRAMQKAHQRGRCRAASRLAPFFLPARKLHFFLIGRWDANHKAA